MFSRVRRGPPMVSHRLNIYPWFYKVRATIFGSNFLLDVFKRMIYVRDIKFSLST